MAILLIGEKETTTNDGLACSRWLRGDGYKYWAMTTEIRQSLIINRAQVDAPTSKVDED